MAKEIHIPLRVKVASGALATFALVAGACASKAGGPEKNPTVEPTATLVSQIDTPLSQSPTPKPEATATPEALKVSEHDITQRIQEIQNLIPQTDIPSLVDYVSALENEVGLNDPRDAQGILNGYGRLANTVQNAVCNGVTEQNVVDSWFMIKNFMSNYGADQESDGHLASGATASLVEYYFSNPTCPALQEK